MFAIVLFVSFTMQTLTIIFSDKLSVFIDSTGEKKPQRIHYKSIPRAGGIPIFLTFSLFSLISKPVLLPFVISFIPTFLVGVFEDYKRTSYKLRFLFMFISSLLAIYTMGAVVIDSGFFEIPYVIAIPFTILGIMGVTNAFNIIDGLNGLSSGIAIITFIIFYHLSNIYHIEITKNIISVLLPATIGFFILNFPWGRIFLGDSGSYFLGFSLAILSILLVNKSTSEISPWFPVVVLFIPIWETLFSIYRRRIKGRSPFMPDRLHTHQLIYKLTNSNSLSSLIILMFHLTISIIALLIHNSTTLLILFLIFLIILHGYTYKFLVRRVGGFSLKLYK